MTKAEEIEKILFLDCDGVISTYKSGWKLDSGKIVLLWHILKATECKIVISSSWRRETLEETLKTTFSVFPFKDSIIGITPRLELPIKQGDWEFDTPFRGLEINAYLNSLEKKVRYAILDDDSDFLFEQKDHLVQTDSYLGLSMEDEIETFRRLINEVYPKGFVSIVSDTWDFWQVVEDFLPKLKKDIMARDGRVVIRPDSGDPVDIICGLRTNPHFHTRIKEGRYYCNYAPFDDLSEYVEVSEGQYYGAYYMLGKTFGWNTTENGFKYPSTKVGLLYGDSITLERQKQIYLRLEGAGMAACNLVLGVGSFTYQFKSRDSLGFAMKATAVRVNGELRPIFKQPKTDDGTKNSLKGLIRVEKGHVISGPSYIAYDMQSEEEEKQGCLETVFKDGKLLKDYTLAEIRERVNSTL